MFDTVRHSAYFSYSKNHGFIDSDTIMTNMMQNDSLVVSSLEDGVLASCPLLLIDRYGVSEFSTPSSPHLKTPSTWTCPNPSCHHINLSNVRRCPYCLMDPNPPPLHVLFVLHGFRV